jgi:hypothetical protein
VRAQQSSRVGQDFKHVIYFCKFGKASVVQLLDTLRHLIFPMA